MKYSVWNNVTGMYSVYESASIPFPRISGRSSNLGAVLSESTDVLPKDSEHIGESEIAVGRIVKLVPGFGQFVFFVLAGFAARWLFSKFSELE